MIQFVTVIHVLVCVVLVLVVLLQQGKKDGMGSAFGGGSQSVFGARGAETFLEKLTKILAIVFMCTSLSLVYFASKESNSSILSNEKTPTTEPTPTATTDATKTDGTPVVPPSAPVPAPTTKESSPVPAPTTKESSPAPAVKSEAVKPAPETAPASPAKK